MFLVTAEDVLLVSMDCKKLQTVNAIYQDHLMVLY